MHDIHIESDDQENSIYKEKMIMIIENSIKYEELEIVNWIS